MPVTPASRAWRTGHGRGVRTWMIRTTPFHERTSALNETGLWEHWSNCLVAQRYQMSEKFEYFAIRNAAGMFDTSPLYKYRITGPEAERFLGGVLARDPRKLAVGHAHYTLWCDDRGFVIEDGVLLHVADEEYLLTAAEPNLAYFQDLVGRLDVAIEDVTEDWAILSVQGPSARDLLTAVAPESRDLGYFGITRSTVAGAPVLVSRTGYTGDLGYEIWARAADALPVWDALAAAGQGRGVIPFGMTALYMARIEAGLVLLDVDFHSSRFAWTDADRTTPIELGLGWMFRDLVDGGAMPELRARTVTTGTTATGVAHSSAPTQSGASCARRHRAGSSPASSSTGATTTGSTTLPGSSRPRTTPRSRTSTTSMTTP
jgi:aminomethyltransferase